ncbi:putative amidoligase enzyme-domain-containing protein [Nemania sp. FL0916]|nr:putative amidoligase enzyme-domain-containing protein [Nemania sp. FL0916]
MNKSAKYNISYTSRCRTTGSSHIRLYLHLASEMATTNEMQEDKPSFGVELEFLVGCMGIGEQLVLPQLFENSKGNPFFLARRDLTRIAIGALVQHSIETTINNAVNSISRGGSRVFDPVAEPYDLRRYGRWSVGQDSSVFLNRLGIPAAVRQQLSEYLWVPIEIASPAMYVSDEAFEEIRTVVQALQDTFWIITPRSAGMHFHYGNGKEYIPFPKLRRMAALTLAADALLVQLHPEHRRANDYCKSNRLYSRAAHGVGAADTARRLRRADDVEAPAEDFRTLPTVRTNRPRVTPPVPPRRFGINPFWMVSALFAARRRSCSLLQWGLSQLGWPRPGPSQPERRSPPRPPFRRGELTGYGPFDPAVYDDGSNDPPRGRQPRPGSRAARWQAQQQIGVGNSPAPIDIVPAVKAILSCTNAPTVAELMQVSPDYTERPAYSFRHYESAEYKRDDGGGELRTVEFRQCAATMVPEEVVAYGKVIMRLCEFAGKAHLNNFWKVVLDCSVAEARGDWYDVFDLLAELGLADEARVLAQSVERFRAEQASAQAVGNDNGGDDRSESRGSGSSGLVYHDEEGDWL